MPRKVVMQRDPDELGLFSLATFQTLRLEALDLFDRSLAEAKPEYLERFLEQQVAQEIAPLELLSQIAEDVHQRLLALRQKHFEARDHIRQTLQNQYGFDIVPFLPADAEQFHRLGLDEALRFVCETQISEEICLRLRQYTEEAFASAEKIYHDVTLADALYAYLMDWLMALHVASVRGSWLNDDIDDSLPSTKRRSPNATRTKMPENSLDGAA